MIGDLWSYCRTTRGGIQSDSLLPLFSAFGDSARVAARDYKEEVEIMVELQ
jgi:hypothetical protein